METTDNFYALRMTLCALFRGYTCAWHTLGAMFATGGEVPKNERLAVWLYTRGAKRGDAQCQYDLGFMQILGQGTRVKTEEGLQWLERSANQDDRSAIRLLFDLYTTGYRGAPIRPNDAERWRQAAYRLEPGELSLTFIGVEGDDFAGKSIDAVDALIDRFRVAIQESKLGSVSRPYPFERGTRCVSIVGPDPDASWGAIEPILKAAPELSDGCHVRKHYGPWLNGVRQERFEFTAGTLRLPSGRFDAP